ncbi:hypothetical protein B0O99DRAFT_520791, partial [Bisporella sp. PMI_857]
CCGLPSGSVPFFGFCGIPNDWFIKARGHEMERCGPLKTLDTAYQTNFKCLGQGPYTGAVYSFRERKRNTAAVAEKCTTPDLLILEDRKKYSLVSIGNSQLDELVAPVSNSTTAADIPEAFKAFEKVE